MCRFPSELEAVGKHHRRVLVDARMPFLKRILGWMGLNIMIEDLSPKISAVEYEQMLSEIVLENEEREEAMQKEG